MTKKKTAAKTATKPTETMTAETTEHGINAAGKTDKNLDAEGNDAKAQEGRAARMETMARRNTTDSAGQTVTVSGR